MDLLTWTYLLVGLSFALYIGIAFWTRAGSTEEFTWQVEVFLL